MGGSSFKYHLALIFANLFFGSNYSFYSSIIGRILSSDELFFVRVAANALFFVPVMLIMGKTKIEWKDIYKIGIIALILVFGRLYLMIDGMNYTSPIDGSIIATMGPILIMLFSALAIKEKITMVRTIGIVLGASGALILILSNAKGGLASGKALGNILIFVSILFSSANTVFVKKLYRKYSPFTIMGWTYLLGIVVTAPFFAPSFFKIDYGSWTPEMFGEVGYIFLFGTMVATGLYNYGLKGVSATASSMYAYTQPIIATALAVARGQDKITSVVVLSALLIFAGVFIVIRSFKKGKSATAETIRQHITH